MAQYAHPMAALGAAGPVAAVSHDLLQRQERQAQLKKNRTLDIRAAKKLARAIVEIVENMDDDDATKFAKLVDLFGINVLLDDRPSYDAATTIEYATKAVLFNLMFNPENGATNSSINLATTLLLYHKVINDVAGRLRSHPVFEGIRGMSNSLFLAQLVQLFAYQFNDGEIDEEESSWLKVTGTTMGASTMAMLVAAQYCQPPTNTRTRSRAISILSKLSDAVDLGCQAVLGTAGLAASYTVQGGILGVRAIGEFGYSTYTCLLDSIGMGQAQEEASDSSTGSPLADREEREPPPSGAHPTVPISAVAPAPGEDEDGREEKSDQESTRSQSVASIESDGFQAEKFKNAITTISTQIEDLETAQKRSGQAISPEDKARVVNLVRSAIEKSGLKLMQRADRWAEPAANPESLAARAAGREVVEPGATVEEAEEGSAGEVSPESSTDPSPTTPP